MIAFLGAGLLGTGFVRNLQRLGETVNVWNRTPEKARASRLMLDAADLAVLPAIAARMDEFLARGHAKDDWTVIGKDAL